jgi:hypothetical protein
MTAVVALRVWSVCCSGLYRRDCAYDSSSRIESMEWEDI